jgi:hypothetical protein
VFTHLLLAVSLAAPVPKAKAPELYYPTVEGTKRVMTMTFAGRTTETTETVSKVTEKDGTFTVTTSREIGGRVVEWVYEVSAKGVFRVTTPGGEKGEPEPLLKLPAKEGDTWASEQPGVAEGPSSKATSTVGKEEEVTVPAGKFKAIPVTTEANLNGQIPIKVTSWYAAGAGVVKTVSEMNGSERVTELKEFTPGKAK